MSAYINLHIEKPCNKEWNGMFPEQQGRYCLSCRKTVVDFTHMTDGDLIAYFRNHSENTCGRFTQNQLNRDMLIPKRPQPWIKYFLRFTLPAFLLSLKSSGQGYKLPIPIEIAPTAPKLSCAETIQTPEAIQGVVTDDNGNLLQGASVYLKGTGKGCVTDEKGGFTLLSIELPATLQFSYVGFQMKEVAVTTAQQMVEVKLSLTPTLLGEVISVGFVVTAKRPRRKVQNAESRRQPKTSEPSVLAYPNPVISGSQLNVQCHSLERGTYVAELFTLAGQLAYTSKAVYGKEDDRISLQLSQLPSGTYLLWLTNEKNGKHFSQHVLVHN